MSEYTSRTYDEDRSLLTLQKIISGNRRAAGSPIRGLFRPGAAQPPARVGGSLAVRELFPHEFPRLEQEVWTHYRDRRAYPGGDRIFGAVTAGGALIGTARCRNHKDGSEVDRVYVLPEYRGMGADRELMNLLVRECGERDALYVHSRTGFINFYTSFGFCPIRGKELPKTIRERFIFHTGDLDLLEVTPMMRLPSGRV